MFKVHRPYTEQPVPVRCISQESYTVQCTHCPKYNLIIIIIIIIIFSTSKLSLSRLLRHMSGVPGPDTKAGHLSLHLLQLSFYYQYSDYFWDSVEVPIMGKAIPVPIPLPAHEYLTGVYYIYRNCLYFLQ